MPLTASEGTIAWVNKKRYKSQKKWCAHAARRTDGKMRLTLSQQIDYMHKLTCQIPTTGTRVVYAKAGTLFAATTITDPKILIDHMAYWATARSANEARYLCAILNSETARALIAPMQPKGQGGARHFDNLIWELPIPAFASRNRLHMQLATAAGNAERVAANVPLDDASYFTKKRRAIRDALIQDGIAGEIDKLVVELLDR